jgi:hypothetical protein
MEHKEIQSHDHVDELLRLKNHRQTGVVAFWKLICVEQYDKKSCRDERDSLPY